MRQRGFTLLELMIVVALIGFLLALAVPGYRESIRKARRAQAQGCLMERSQFLERFYTTNLRYDQDSTGAAPPAISCSTDVTRFYSMSNGTLAPTAYTLAAAPRGEHGDDTCGRLTLDHTGAKSASKPDCWK